LTTGKAQLDDVPCNSTYQYICEVNISEEIFIKY
jgi:hypothetical protein